MQEESFYFIVTLPIILSPFLYLILYDRNKESSSLSLSETMNTYIYIEGDKIKDQIDEYYLWRGFLFLLYPLIILHIIYLFFFLR